MDTQTLMIYVGGFVVAVLLLKIIIKIPLMLLKYGLLALMIYVAYLYLNGRL